jgi:hypothetical protein
MIKEIQKLIIEFRIGLLHATYHRNMKRATNASGTRDLVAFKKHIYKAEDAWRKLVILINSKSYKGENTDG